MERIILSTDRINYDSRRKIKQTTFFKINLHSIVKKNNILCIEDINNLSKPSSAIDSNLYYITSINNQNHTFKVKPVIEQVYHLIGYYNSGNGQPSEHVYYAMLKKDKEAEEIEIPFGEIIPHYFFDRERKQMDFKYPVYRIKYLPEEIADYYNNH